MTRKPSSKARNHLPEPSPSDRLVFNGIDGSTGDYLVPSMSVAQIVALARGSKLADTERAELERQVRQAQQASFGAIEGMDLEDLAQVGWAVVFPAVQPGTEAAGRQIEILGALAPLLKYRRAQATRENEHFYREFCAEQGYQPGETKQQFLGRLGAGHGAANPEQVPYYLLLVASPEEIPYRIQYQLDVQYAVGRIYFETIEEYRRYACSVVEAETGVVTRALRAAFFGVANRDDRATQLSHAYLAKPLAHHVEERFGRAGWTVERIFAEEATHARLCDVYRNAPALLFTASHGMGFPCGDERQRRYQGALLCQDWGGPSSGTVERGHYFTGEDIAACADLRGMIAMHFACFGMGTPERDDAMSHVIGSEPAKHLAPRELVARLPQHMLAHPGGGALAVLGHIDRAWSSSFLWIDAQGKYRTQKHLQVFEGVLTSILQGKRVGHAMESFNLRYAEMASDLIARLEERWRDAANADDVEIARMWVFKNDARSYAVVGDPAVRLPRPGKVDGTSGGVAGARGTELRSDPSSPVQGGPDAGLRVAYATEEPPSGELETFGLFGSKDKAEPGLMARLCSKVSETLGQVIGDAVTLEVKTYVSSDIQRAAASKDGLPGEASTQLRAYTRCGLDGDIDACVPVTADGQIDQALWALHASLVEQAQKHRTELVKIMLSLLGPLVDK